jgi:hypothetical protein
VAQRRYLAIELLRDRYFCRAAVRTVRIYLALELHHRVRQRRDRVRTSSRAHHHGHGTGPGAARRLVAENMLGLSCHAGMRPATSPTYRLGTARPRQWTCSTADGHSRPNGSVTHSHATPCNATDESMVATPGHAGRRQPPRTLAALDIAIVQTMPRGSILPTAAPVLPTGGRSTPRGQVSPQLVGFLALLQAAIPQQGPVPPPSRTTSRPTASTIRRARAESHPATL